MTETQTIEITRTIDLLGDAEPDIRLRAALDLGTWNATEAASALVDRLGRERLHPIRETLSWAVLRMPEAARPALGRALQSDRWLARMQACHVLSKLGDPADAPLIRPLIADEVDAVASRAWWAVAQARLGSLAGDLAGQLGRGDSELRNSLSIALVELTDAATAPLVATLREGTRDAREHAADALGLLGSPAADPATLALVDALDDSDRDVRFAALNALGQIDTALAHRALRDAASSPDARLAELSRRFPVDPRSDSPRDARLPGDRAGSRSLLAHAPNVLLELTCVTDFVAGSATFARLAQEIADLASGLDAESTDDLLSAQLNGRSVRETLSEVSALTGEAVAIGRVARLAGPSAGHLQVTASGTTIGALISWTGDPDARLVGRLLHQVATCAPGYLTRSDVPTETLEEIGAEAMTSARASGKPEHVIARLSAGRVEAFLHEAVLTEQVSVADPGVLIDDLLRGTGVHLTGFARMEAGVTR